MKKRSERRREKRTVLLSEGKKVLVPLKHTEFKCPNCKGVASVVAICGQITAECHSCGLKGTEVM